MSQPTATAFLRHLQHDQALQARLASSAPSGATAIVAFAAEEGFAFSESDYIAAVQAMSEAASHEGGELSDSVLETVAGGMAVPAGVLTKKVNKDGKGFAAPTYATTPSSGFAMPTWSAGTCERPPAEAPRPSGGSCGGGGGQSAPEPEPEPAPAAPAPSCS